MDYTLDLKEYARIARQAAAEGCVLLKNENETLPLRAGDRIAIFGRIAFHYYKSGLGSGGMVNTRYVVSILDALKEEPDLTVNARVEQIYADWIEKNPYDGGRGWGQVPWSQKEMPVTEELLAAAEGSDAAVVIIGRTAGEDQDNSADPGSYLLTDTEKELITKVSARFARTVVVLNVGNIVDMTWVEECHPAAVLYAWQGGQEGGNGVCDVLTGRVNPCGRLTDTIARSISDYPSDADFGDPERNFYKEDIYVGYRYFETFAKEKVLYPFGYGLSYTTFETKAQLLEVTEDAFVAEAVVANTGSCAGKEVVQVYVEAPQGKLGKPSRVLAGFAKTGVIAPGGEETVRVEVPKYTIASYDDGGAAGAKSCWVLEAGIYHVYAGADVRSAALIGSFEEEFRIVERLQEAYAPTQAFERMRPVAACAEDETDVCAATAGTADPAAAAKACAAEAQRAANTCSSAYTLCMEPVPLRTADPAERRLAGMPKEIPYTGDQGYVLGDVVDGKISLDTFVAQLSDEDLIAMFHGEGMCSPRVTPGTAAAFGGVSDSLVHFGIPAACCSDGPSGIRMDCGTKAFSMPNGTLLGCTFNLPLVEELYQMEGRELRKNRIDTLLGPGMNIHRHPLNGRNFEYISEDPLLTGKMAAAQVRGMEESGVTGTIKHFCGNNQEMRRHQIDSVISERALREIYLKGFEIAVKEGKARSVMTTYGAVNGIWTAGSYDLNTTILRKEWGFTGIVMTDWWAVANDEGQPSDRQNHAPMVRAQNDVFMVTQDASDFAQDNVKAQLLDGRVERSELQRNAKNILNFIMNVPAMQRILGRISQEELEAQENSEDAMGPITYYQMPEDKDELVIDGSAMDTSMGHEETFGISGMRHGKYSISLVMKSDLGELAQLPVAIYYDNNLKAMISVQGSEGKTVTEKRDIGFAFGSNHYLKLYFGGNGLTVERIILRLEEAVNLKG